MTEPPSREECEALIERLEKWYADVPAGGDVYVVMAEAAHMLRDYRSRRDAAHIPREPTPEMLDAGSLVYKRIEQERIPKWEPTIAAQFWQAMYDAAPKALQEPAHTPRGSTIEEMRRVSAGYASGAIQSNGLDAAPPASADAPLPPGAMWLTDYIAEQMRDPERAKAITEARERANIQRARMLTAMGRKGAPE